MRTVLFVLLAITTLISAQEADSTSYTNTDTFETIMLDEHNKFRLEHDAEPLTWNDTLADFADAHNQDCAFEHSNSTLGYGENLAAGYENATAVVDAWADEREEYNFEDQSSPSAGTGHFTQMVWNTTRQVGCAAKECVGILTEGVSGWYVTCEYYPVGNVVGEYDAHVNKGTYSAGDRKSPSGLFVGCMVIVGVYLVL